FLERHGIRRGTAAGSDPRRGAAAAERSTDGGDVAMIVRRSDTQKGACIMPHDTFEAGDLTAIIGDNTAPGRHRAGSNARWSLVHPTEPANLFVPEVAGLNFEHIFDGNRFDMDKTKRIFFEPRNVAMEFRRVSATEAELHQPPTPTFHLESWTRFAVVAPHYV